MITPCELTELTLPIAVFGNLWNAPPTPALHAATHRWVECQATQSVFQLAALPLVDHSSVNNT